MKSITYWLIFAGSLILCGCRQPESVRCDELNLSILSELGDVKDWPLMCGNILNYKELGAPTRSFRFGGSEPSNGGGWAMMTLVILDHRKRELKHLGYDLNFVLDPSVFVNESSFGNRYESQMKYLISNRIYTGSINCICTKNGPKFASLTWNEGEFGRLLDSLLGDKFNPKGIYHFPWR